MLWKFILEFLLSGPACGVVAGSKIPNYCVMSDTSNVARVMEKMGEGMRIHTSGVTKAVLSRIEKFDQIKFFENVSNIEYSEIVQTAFSF